MPAISEVYSESQCRIYPQ